MDDNKVPFKLNGLVTGTISVISVIMNNTIKKIIFFIATILCLTSCSKNTSEQPQNEKIDTWADKAEAFFPHALDEAVPHDWQTQPFIYDVDVWCNNDSTKTYVKRFKMKYYNQFGGMSNGRFFYVYVWDKEKGVIRYNISENGSSYLLRDGNDDEWTYQDKAVTYCIVFGGSYN